MKPVTIRMVAIAVALAAAISVRIARSADQDPVKAEPGKYAVLMDNEHARVLDVRLKAGEKSTMHSHPAHIVYSFGPGKVRFTAPDGKSEEVEFKAGQTVWRNAESHAVENIGDTECHALNIEFKGMTGQGERVAHLAKWQQAGGHEHAMTAAADLKWEAGPASLPAGAQLAMLEGDMKRSGPFTFRAKLPAGYKIPAHFHPADEHVTVLSGTLIMGMGDKLDESKGKEIAAGGFALMPAGSHHFAMAREETILQIHGIGPWGITYINPADDPRNAEKSKH